MSLPQSTMPAPTAADGVSMARLAPRYVEGTWLSPGYRSGGTRAKLVLVLFAITILAAALESLMAFQAASLMGEAANGYVSSSEFASLASTAEGVDGFYALAVICLAVAFLAWLSRTVENVPALGAGTPQDSPRWAIGWWFVPIAFLWKPYGVVREAWDRLASTTQSGEGKLVLAWWLTWIGSAIGGRFAQYSIARVTNVEEATSIFWLTLVTSLTALAAAVLGFLVVREIQARADAMAKQLGFEQSLPHAARVSGGSGGDVQLP